ncbi:VOC family protein [Pseudochrobactrum algeriensis]|uniref:VOC family protein n=1 Tax=Pseudochrobactrum algeriensis TaxID=2834768 RepID=UPI001BCF3DFD|nr:VOC family protein [Pseudochrobactrum algeriensis]MBX8811376.1 VOC family protein [Ochrobactrum sp. MR34]QVQ38034.1 VOC family protein [Pseudochrobactrum algeriensis]QVQ41256.1 VOC family protein [Pseudochrobactrum algeriensis]QVQ45180.1 VOC family protein [Pseudochrobactrum algeriensis]
MMKIPTFRIVRPTDNPDALLPFYRDGLGLTVLDSFQDHDGFDAIIMGRENVPYHFAFTRTDKHQAGKAPTKENLLVFYLPDHAEWENAVERMKATGFVPVSAFNPYWDKKGVTFEDPDGYRIVLQQADWAP